MRNFTDVLQKLITLSKDDELTGQFNKIYEDTTMTAPEARWEIRGRQVSDALFNYSCTGKGSTEDWFAGLLAEFTQKSIDECKKNILFIKQENTKA